MNDIQKIELEMLNELNTIALANRINYYLGYGSVLGAVRSNSFIPWDTDIDVIVEYDQYEKLCECLSRELSERYCLVSYKLDSSYDSLKARIYIVGEDHHNIHIDIFPLIGLPDGKFIQRIIAIIARLIYKTYYVKLLPLNIHSDRKKIYIVKLLKIIGKIFSRKFLVMCFEFICNRYSTSESNYFLNSCGSYGFREIIPRSYLGNGIMINFETLMVPIPAMYDQYLKHFYGQDYIVPKKSNYLS
jgi:lipopolysaccharide cholinephosphotransferase